ncbi:c-type cytochrome [Acidiphilium sp. PA]|uniref:c-type cytochrome n=1 Tax=Acidiphilium sp. PA TaxID=2871705 RepID=UPI002244CFE9|nr:c-type cytochrome [Acidiphilium sp. PA]MCW8308004.1 c-type cytochrome [Acidiphilium sp. PA]
MRQTIAAPLLALNLLASTSHAHAAPPPGPLAFTPPPESAMPGGKFGDAVKRGENIFRHTTIFEKGVIGNALNCSNCHLDAGRLAGSAPMWAAYNAYPAYRSKNGKVNSFGMRLQGCFAYSENGKVPALGSPTIVALEAYAYWLTSGAPTGTPLAGRGYPELAPPPKPATYAAGAAVYASNCALCHGAAGQGQYARGQTVFPALWGDKSFNWGAGMGSIKNAAAFVHANMPYGAVGTLSVQQSWDVATYIDSQNRPQDPRFTNSVAVTRSKYHNNKYSMYGKTVNGHVLGDQAPGTAP